MFGLGPVEVLLFSLLIGLPVALIYGLYRKSHPQRIDDWAAAHGVTLTPTSREVAERYLGRGMRWRTRGALIGILIPFGTKIPGLEMLMGYLVGAILAEVTAPPIVAAANRASLMPRAIRDYLPGYARSLFRALCVGAAAVALCWYVVPLREDLDTEGFFGPPVIAAAAVVVLALVEWCLRYIVRRPQPAGDPALVALDDAVRSASMHATMGAGIGVSFLLLGAAVFAVGLGSDVQILRWIGPLGGIFCLGAGISFWLQLGHDSPWRVRRTGAAGASA